jgi:hypothetical protein
MSGAGESTNEHVSSMASCSYELSHSAKKVVLFKAEKCSELQPH